MINRKVRIALIFFLGFSLSEILQGQIIVSIDSSLNYPSAVAYSNKNIFYTNSFSNQVSEVSSSGDIVIAGSGAPDYYGDGGPATNASLYNPVNLCVDGNGNILIADMSNNRIRKVFAATGIITTVAGDTAYGYNGDTISATLAELRAPQGVAVDDSGNIYIADAGNNRIRKVEVVSGKIYTIAGNGTAGYNGDGIATKVEINGPAGLFIDNKRRALYIADQNNSRIRKLNMITDSLITIAGNGAGGYNGNNIVATTASLYAPSNIVLDTAGNLYIADNYNDRIREVLFSTGKIIDIAGNGQSGFSGDGGLATNCELDGPIGVCTDDSGNVYIADEINDRIRKVKSKYTGLSNLSNENYFTVTPNPSADKFNFTIYGEMNKSMLEVYDIMGNKLFDKVIIPSNHSIAADMSNYADGIYFYKITSTGEIIGSGKLVLKR